jgi:ubiquinone/menaquinone biosynthesis C-methylase UbiE
MPAAAYDAFAPYYESYAETRKRYHRRIDDIVIAHARHADSLLDVGAGDGRRALRIAQSAGVARVVLLEPSAGMRAQCPEGAEIWPWHVLEIPDDVPSFEIITCLWNVLGHVQEAQQRLFVLARLKRLLSERGMIFLDVSNRYNAACYGWTKTLLRMTYDFFLRSEKHGDVIVSWEAGGRTIRTRGHVFTHAEMKRLFRTVGLKIVTRWVIDYETGAERNVPVAGHLLYQLAAA